MTASPPPASRLRRPRAARRGARWGPPAWARALLLAALVLGAPPAPGPCAGEGAAGADSGLEEAKKRLQEDPLSVEARLGMAEALMNLGRFRRAREYIADVLETHPRHPAATISLAGLEYRIARAEAAADRPRSAQRHCRRALAYLDAALRDSPDAPALWKQQAWCLMQTGEDEAALEVLDRLLGKGTDDPEPAVWAAELRARRGRAQEAVEALETAGAAAQPPAAASPPQASAPDAPAPAPPPAPAIPAPSSLSGTSPAALFETAWAMIRQGRLDEAASLRDRLPETGGESWRREALDVLALAKTEDACPAWVRLAGLAAALPAEVRARVAEALGQESGGGTPSPTARCRAPRRVLAGGLRYPETARTRGITGSVELLVVVGPDGGVRDVFVLKAHASASRRVYEREFAQAAKEAAAHWRYEPAVLDGRPVAAAAFARLVFDLTR